MHGDVSFTFLDRIEEVELNIVDGRWQSALALALTLPDICGGIAFPEIVKHYRDGRVMLDRQKNPTRDVGTQYIRWFDEYAGDHFKLSQSDEKPYICGERCWQLRCEYLHQNKGFLNDENNIHFHLGLNCGMSVCQLDSMNIQENRIDIRIDIEHFCLRMCKAAKSYYDKVNLEKDFSLYNTPVLDFIQVTQKKKDASIIALICGNERYAKGLKEALQFISEQIMLFYTPESAKTKLGKHKPDLWIVTEDMTRQPNQPWRADRTTPVIIITGNPDAVEIKKNSGKLTVLSMPLSIVDLRKNVEIYVSCREEKFMLYIILLFAFIVIYLMMLMRRQKDKMSEIKIQMDQLQAQHDELQKERDQLLEQMNHLEEQREHLQIQTDQAFRRADEIEKICDEIWHHANTIHLYSSLAEEESKSITMKEKHKVIIRTTEEILNIIYKYKGNV